MNVLRSGDPLLLITFAVAALFLISLGFAVVVFVLHFRNQRRSERFDAIERDWEPVLLESLFVEPGRLPALTIGVAHRRHFLGYLVRFARRVRGPERDVLKQLADPMLDDLLPQLRSRRPEVRARAVQTLGTLGLPRYAEPILAALDDPSPMVAMTAATRLARREYPQYAAAVLSRLHRFDQWHPNFLASLLANIGPEATLALRATLADTAVPPRSRAVAAKALTSLRDLGGVSVACAALAETQDPELLQAGLQMLAVVAGPDVLPLVRAYALHPVPFVRAEALGALAHLGTEEDVHLLDAALEDSSPWVALRAGYALGSAHRFELLQSYAERSDQPGIVAREVLSEVRA